MKKKKKKRRRRRQSAEELHGPACCVQATVQAASSRVADERTGGRAGGQTNRHGTQLLVLSRLVSNGARQRDRTAVLPPPRAPPLPMPAVTGYGIAG
ncbi:unnamed protein product [Sphagnum jensenii]